MRQLDIGPRVPSAPIPGSARDKAIQARVQAQAERILPGIGPLEPKARKPHGPLRRAWGEAASSAGMALALSLRVRGVRWVLRVLGLTALIMASQPVLWAVVMPLWIVSQVWRMVRWFEAREKRKGHPNGGLPTCQCGH